MKKKITFFVNKFLLARLVTERLNPRLESMFAVGVDEMSWDDLDAAHYDWPTVDEVRDYRRQVRNLVTAVIDEAERRLQPMIDKLTAGAPQRRQAVNPSA